MRSRIVGLGLVLTASVSGGLFPPDTAAQADNDESKLPALAAELVGAPVDLIVTSSTPAARAAKTATTTLPIVFINSANPVKRGLVASVARPGGNVTGFTLGNYDDKSLEVLKDCVPGLSRVGWLGPDSSSGRTEATGAGQSLGVRILFLPVDGPPDLTQALEAAAGGGLAGLVVTDLSWVWGSEYQQIADFALAQRLPAIGPDKRFA